MSQIADAAELLQLSVNDVFDKAETDERKIEVLNTLFLSMKSFSRDWKSHLSSQASPENPDCPDGWVRCPDGSCVPEGAGCGESLNFVNNELMLSNRATAMSIAEARDFLVAYINAAATTYFDQAKNVEEQLITTRLLEVARLDFKGRIAPKALLESAPAETPQT